MSTATLTTETRTVCRQFVDALVAWDGTAVRELLSDEVWLRALLVREFVEHHDAAAALSVLHGWYGSAHETQLLHADVATVGTRQRLTYRVRLRPAWAPQTWHVIEQTGYVRVVDGLIGRLDLACTGFQPEA
ncbi:hypothetical protein [Egicoccus sp. AB-alg2]|uniref:hypothetical protein n=1 Tax=Egicoccus sp. AB-alg2 TaxID=3242693 RepID=UPI00359EC769